MRILLLDELTLVRESLRQYLDSQRDCTVVASCGDAQCALAELRARAIDVILIGDDPASDGVAQFVRQHRKESLPGKIVYVSRELNRRLMIGALEAGVKGIILQRNPPELLVSALRRIEDGLVWIDPALQNGKPAAQAAPSGKLRRPLTNREQEVYQAVLDGLTNKEIGERLGTSEIAVKASLQHIFDKTGVRTRTQLVRLAMSGARE
jgi:two-component system nitrate/nitrite response regulator NarL